MKFRRTQEVDKNGTPKLYSDIIFRKQPNIIEKVIVAQLVEVQL